MFFLSETELALTRLFPLIGFQIITESSSLEDLPCLERASHLSDKPTMTVFRGIATTIVKYSRQAKPLPAHLLKFPAETLIPVKGKMVTVLLPAKLSAVLRRNLGE